jgi:hypothetical protein
VHPGGQEGSGPPVIGGADGTRTGGRGNHHRQAGKPIAWLTPIAAPVRKKHLELLKGKIKVPDNFNAPLDDEIISIFEGR